MRTLLLADDSVTVQRVIALTFADEPISVITCGDGQRAMELMTAQRPDIVLAGTVLAQVSGYDLARFMRSRPELRDVPVLLLSGAFETVDDARLKASGANGVIEKPVEPNNVIGRVKELLGLKSEAKPATAGRLITSADAPAEKKLPVAHPPRAVTSMRGTPSKWDQLRDQAGLDPNPRLVEDAATRSDDYLDTLDAAFDNLDQQLSGRVASARPSRNPSGPLGQASGAADPRSPGRRPQNGGSAPGNPVFEVDDEWFGGEDNPARADARAGRREIQEDLRAPELQAPPEASPNTVFEVDDDWFAEDNKARAARQIEQRVLAAEMGIHEVELPHTEPVPNAPAAPSDLDFDFGLEDIKKLRDAAVVADAPVPAAPPVPPSAAAPEAPAPIAPAPEAPHPPYAEREPASVMPTSPIIPLPSIAPAAPAAAASSRDVATDFAQLLAFEQGEHHEPPMAAPPEITEEMLGDIVSRVTERLNTGAFIDHLRIAMTATVTDAAREIATATSERLVREIATAASERIVRDIATAASERIVHDIATAMSERVVRDIASDTSERLVREIASETSERLVRGIVSETSERLVRDEIERIKSKSRT